ncbi:MAG: carboxymuconolactone decarboxylase family protein [bacterium]
MADDEKYQRGLANRRKVFGDEGEERRKVFEAASPDFARFVTEQVYGDLYERKGIDPKVREMVILAIICTLGRDREFEVHVKAGLNVGMTKKDIQEVLMICAIYAAAPNAVGAAQASLRVFEERGI